MKRWSVPCLLCLLKRWSVPYLLLFILFLVSPAGVAAREASYYQKELTPVASRVLLEMQEFNRKGEYQKSLQRFDKFSRGGRKEYPVLLNFMAANLNFQLSRYSEAVRLYRLVVAKAPEFDAVYENLGMALILTESYKAAVVNLLEGAVRLPEKSRKLRYQAAIAALYGEDFVKSRLLLLGLLEENPQPPVDWLKALIQVYLRLAENRAALQVAARLVDSYPDDHEHWRHYGQVALVAEEYQTALSAYKVLQSAGRTSLKERKLIARIYQHLQLPGRAAAEWESVFVDNPPVSRELETLIALYQQSGEAAKALRYLDHLQKLNPDIDTAFRRGKILYYAGRYREAYKIFTKLEKIAEDDGYQHLLAGYCAWNENDFPAAAASWSKAANYPAWQDRSLNLLRTLKPWLEPATSG